MNKHRRKHIQNVINKLCEARSLLEEMCGEEDDALSSMPENLRDSDAGAKMSDAIDTMQEALDGIEEAENSLTDMIEG